MKMINVNDREFRKYGRVIENVDLTSILEQLSLIPVPTEGSAYKPSVEELENDKAAKDIQRVCFGELPIEIGYCTGHNKMLNGVEYHRCSEVNIAAKDAVLFVGKREDIEEDYTYDTSLMEAVFVPKGTAVELFATTLHYTPCSTGEEGFMMGVVLPKGTNFPLEEKHENGEDAIMTSKNKWFIGHPEGNVKPGRYIGLKGKNLSLDDFK